MKIWYRQSMSMLRIENNCLNGLNILNKMIKRKERKIIKTSFSFWKKKNRHHINFQNKINKFYKNNCRVALRRYYNTWVDVLYHTLHIQSIFKRSLQRFNSNRLSLCWYNWNDYIDTVNLYKNKIQNFCNIYDKYVVTANHNLLTRCYLKWKLKSNFSVSIDALIDQKTYDTKRVLLIRSTIYKLRTLSTNSLGNALRKWKTKTEEHRRYMYGLKKNVQLIVRYIQFNFKNVKSQAWNIWLASCRYKAHVEHLLYTARSRWKHQIVSSSYRTWYIHVHASIRQRNQIKLLFLRVIHKTKFHFINKWKRFVTQQKKKTFKFKLFMEKWQMKQETVEKLCIKHVFNKLMYNIYFSRIIELSTIKNEDTKNRKFKILRRFLKKKKERIIHLRFLKWFERTKALKEKEINFKTSMSFWINQSLSKSFNTWYVSVTYGIRSKQMKRNVLNLLNRSQKNVTNTFYQKWSLWYQDRKYCRGIVNRQIFRLMYNRKQQGFDTWVSVLQSMTNKDVNCKHGCFILVRLTSRYEKHMKSIM